MFLLKKKSEMARRIGSSCHEGVSAGLAMVPFGQGSLLRMGCDCHGIIPLILL